MSRASTGLPAVAAFTLVVPMLATPAAATPPAPMLPVQPPQYLLPPEPEPPWLIAGIDYAPSADDAYDLYGFEQDEDDGAPTLVPTEDPVTARTDDAELPLDSVQPAFSPDGSQVVFSAEQAPTEDAEWHLMVGDVAPAAEGPGVSNVRPLDYPRVAGAADYQPAWSPDGQHLAFVREYSGSGPRAEDGPQVQILDLANPDVLVEVALPEDPAGTDEDYRWTSEPTWAPDGTGLILVGSIGPSTGTAFAPVDPDMAGTGSLWYYEVTNGSVHHLTVSEPGCGGDVNPCEVPVNAGTAAWSPTDPATVAFTPWWENGVALLALPENLPTDGTADVALTESATPLFEDTEPPQLQDLAWDPDGSALYASESGSAQIFQVLPEGGASPVYDDVGPLLLGLAFQPWSDLGITLDVPGTVHVGTHLPITAEVTNAGPAPSRPGQVQVGVDYNFPPGNAPAGCEFTAPTELECTVELGGLDPGESTQVEITAPALDHMAVPNLTAVVTSDSPEQSATAANNHTTASIRQLDDPSLTTDTRNQRISFAMDRLHEEGVGNGWSMDLVQSFTSPAGDTVEENYRILAADQVEEVTAPDGDTIPGPFQALERGIDYSPDGSQAVFVRSVPVPSDSPDRIGDPSRLRIADVVGTHQPERGTPGQLVNTREVATDPTGCEGVLAWDRQPSWSPNGELIAFVRSCETSEGLTAGRIMLLEVATGVVYSPFAAGSAEIDPEATMNGPSWSTDSAGLTFTSEQPDGDGTDSIWLVPLNTGIPHQLVLQDGVCWPGTDQCDGPVTAEDAEWSPDGRALAFVDRQRRGDVVYIADLPGDAVRQAILLEAGEPLPVTGLRTLAGFYPGEAPGDALLRFPTWSPDGTEVAVVPFEESSPREIRAVDVVTGESSTLFTGYYGSWLYDPEYEPYSDLWLTIDTGSARAGSSTDLTLTVLNVGPVRARDALVTLTLPDGVTTGTLPEECSAADRSLTCTLTDPIPAGAELPLTLSVTATEDGSHTFAGTVVTNSVDPDPSNDEATATLDATSGASERIAFSMERPGEAAGELAEQESLDLVRSLTVEPGEPAAATYTVLAAAVLDEVTNIDETGGDLGPLLATEDNLDYTADGSRAVFTRSADLQYGYTDDQRLVIADVVGTQQGDLGEPGELIDLEVVPDAPGTLPGDLPGGDRVSATDPVWSPDASQIAFVRMVTANDGEELGRIMLLDADEGAMTSPFDPDWLATTADPDGSDYLSGRMTSPTWSPGGDALIYGWQGPAADGPELQYLPLSTGIPHALILPTDGSVCWPGFGGDWCDGPVQGFEPAWAPDGDQVALSYWASGGLGIAVATLAADTAERALDPDSTVPLPIAALDGVEQLTPDISDAPPAHSPAWSPDGQRLAAAVGSSDYIDEIAAVHLATGERATMFQAEDVPTDLAHPEFEPWSDLAVTIAPADGRITTGTPAPVTVIVTNRGPSPARDAVVRLALPSGARAGTLPDTCTAEGRTLTCDLSGPVPTDAEAPLTVPVTFTTTGEHRIRATVTTNSIDTEPGNDTTARTFTVTTPPDDPRDPTGRSGPRADVQVQLSLDADRAWLGGTGLPAQVTVTNQGTEPAREVQLRTELPSGVLLLDAGACPLTGACDLGTLASGDQVNVALVLQPTAVGQVEVSANATSTTRDPREQNNTDSASFEAVQAQLRLLPSVAEPGEVSLLYGVDLPPDAQITVRWAEGVTSTQRPITASEDGTLRTPMLIVDGDQLGRRDLLVTSVSGTVFGLETPPTMLVVPQSVTPPNFLGRN